MGRTLENNNVTVIGVASDDFTFRYEIFGEKFYTSKIGCKRLSGKVDVIPVTVSERLLGGKDTSGWFQKTVIASGTFRSYDQHTETGNHLILSVFCDEFKEVPDLAFVNEIMLCGFICKDVVYRKTPLGREISEILLAVNRNYGKSDYIPCIAWGRSARFSSRLKVGDQIMIGGRIQSRHFRKRLEDGSSETRTAYEVSASTLQVVGESEAEDEDL